MKKITYDNFLKESKLQETYLQTILMKEFEKKGFAKTAVNRSATSIVNMLPNAVKSNKNLLVSELVDIAEAIKNTSKNI